MYGLSSFFIGEQRVAEELGPMMRAAPTEEMRIFLCTQIADEARHVRFFNRFYDEVGVLEADNLQDRLAETSEHLNPQFNVLFDEMLKGRVDHLARAPGGPRDAGRGRHALPHDHRGNAGPHRPALHHSSTTRSRARCPGFVEGFTNIARDEHRHVAFGARFLRDMAQEDTALPRRDPAHARGVRAGGRRRAHAALVRRRASRALRRTRLEETRAFAMKALERRLKVIGLTPVATA